jgi:copper chaperone CopZ
MKVEVLYSDGCPNHRPAVELVREVLREDGVEAEVAEVNVSDPGLAEVLGFLGSPTVRVNGLDVEPSARSAREYGMMCRTYCEAGRREGLPSKALVRAAIREALATQSGSQDCCNLPTSAVALPFKKARRPVALIGGSVAAAALASFCCILPIVFALTGVTVIGASALFAAWRPYLLGVTFGLLGLGFYFAYRPSKGACAPGSSCTVPAARRRGRVALWLAAAAVSALAAFPYFSAPLAELLLREGQATGSPPKPPASDLQKVSLLIEGMDCGACATAVENKLRAVSGVRDAKVSYENGVAEVQFRPGSASVEQLERAIEEAGYRVKKT